MAWNRIRRTRMTKMGNTPSTCAAGHSHRSKLEGAVCAMIGLREKAGELKLLQAECNVYLTAARVRYVADFKCEDLKTGAEVYIEAKGYHSQRWPMIKRLWKHFGPGKLEIWKGSYTRPVLDEVIEPVGGEK